VISFHQAVWNTKVVYYNRTARGFIKDIRSYLRRNPDFSLIEFRHDLQSDRTYAVVAEDEFNILCEVHEEYHKHYPIMFMLSKPIFMKYFRKNWYSRYMKFRSMTDDEIKTSLIKWVESGRTL
jgi:hypothetical protein